MYKILVVDDEKLAREDVVYKIGSSGIPTTWIMEAESGEEALQIISANRPDIMLTDIMMGEMSGLDLIREANNILPQMISVIICGYPDFSFAQSAIKLGATSYLLKPVKPSELSGVLSETAKQLRSRWEQNNLSSTNYALNKKLENYALRERINAFINDGTDKSADDISPLLADNAVWFQVWDIRISDPEKKYIGHHNGEAALLYGLCNIVREISENVGQEETLVPVDKFGGKLTAAVLATSSRTAEEAAHEKLSYCAKRIQKVVAENLGVGISIGISRVSPSLSSEIVIEARKALDVRYYYKNQSEFILDYAILISEAGDQFHEAEMAVFKKAVNEGNIEEAVRMADTLIFGYAAKPCLGLRDSYMDIIRSLARSSYKKGTSILKFLGYENIGGSIIDQFETVEEAAANLKSIITMTLGSWVKYMETTSDVLEKVKKHIDENFTDSELCTSVLAKTFCISVGYLSAAYKKTYDITITKYITEIRMEYAAKMLIDSNTSINRISEICGFNNASYFMRVFKTHYKIPPAQYRNEAKIE